MRLADGDPGLSWLDESIWSLLLLLGYSFYTVLPDPQWQPLSNLEFWHCLSLKFVFTWVRPPHWPFPGQTPPERSYIALIIGRQGPLSKLYGVIRKGSLRGDIVFGLSVICRRRREENPLGIERRSKEWPDKRETTANRQWKRLLCTWVKYWVLWVDSVTPEWYVMRKWNVLIVSVTLDWAG